MCMGSIDQNRGLCYYFYGRNEEKSEDKSRILNHQYINNGNSYDTHGDIL